MQARWFAVAAILAGVIVSVLLALPTAPPVVAQAPSAAQFGDGADGDFGGGDPNTVRSALAGTASAGQALIPVTTTAGFAIGQEVLIIQMQGTGAGSYEFGVIAGLGPGALALQQGLGRTYTQDGVSRAQVLRVPHFATVVGAIATAEWDGSSGGIVAFRALTVTNAGVDVSARGFKGGYGNDSAIHVGGICQVSSGQGQAQQGTSYPGTGGCSKAANGGGGGGAGNPAFVPNSEFGSGGGGGYGSPGGNGAGGAPGVGGASHGDADLSTIFLGSGGGGGTWGTNPYGGGRRSIQGNDQSGQGGGAAFIAAGTITGLQVFANGYAGGDSNGGFGGYAGGGGSGGAIKIIGDTVSLGTVQALGGPGGDGTIVDGGNGGVGRIRIEYCDSLTGSTDPPASTQQLGCNTPPTVTPPADQYAAEGAATPVALGAFTDPDADSPWSVDVGWGDGSADTIFNAAAPGALGSQGHAYTDDGSYTVTVTVTDKDGGIGTASFMVTVANVAPTATFNAPASVNEGSPINLSLAGPSDPSSADTAAGFSYAFDCGDGAGYGAFSADISANCPTSDNGTRTVRGKIRDKDGGITEYSAAVTVNNVAPTATLGNSGPVNEGSAATVIFSNESDPSGADTAAGFRYAFSCTNGDLSGATYANSGTAASTICTFDDGPSTRTVRARIIDKDGGFTEYTTDVTATNVAPGVSINGAPASSLEGATINLTSTVTDPSAADTAAGFTYAWTVTKNGAPCASGSGASFSFTPDDDGSYAVTLTATDKDGGTGTDTKTISVTNVAPTVDAGTDETLSEGDTLSRNGSFTDPGTDAWTATVDYGDGSGVQPLALNPDKTFTLNHAYADNGSYTVTVTVTDDDGGAGSDTVLVTVNNVAPTMGTPTVSPEPSDEGSTAKASATFSDPGADDGPFTCVVNYGDGSGDLAGTVVGATCTGPAHTYADNGSYIVTAKVTDKDGGVGSTSTSHTVHNVAPTITSATGPVNPAQLGSPISISAIFTDPGTFDTHTAQIDWGDGPTSPGAVSEAGGSGTITASYTYMAAGVYTVKVTVTDKDGGFDTMPITTYVVVYDPNGGFVTGAGWIDSPAGACLLTTVCQGATGRAHFGFSAKYQRGATTPSGQTAFRFQAGDLDFASTSYDWLVVAGSQAKYKGRGTINGAGDYGFMVTAIDGTPDRFRIKIWVWGTDTVVYDNQLGAPEDGDAATDLGGGNIVVHK